MSGKFVPMTEALHNYVLAHRSNANDPVLAALQAETRSLGDIAGMATSLDQASLLTLLVATIGAKSAVEIGTFTGTSSISIARGLAPGGKLVCFDSDFKFTSIARRYWIKAGVQDRIDLRLGDAHRLVAHFRPTSPLDFVYIDADKEAYDMYYELLFPYVRTGGLILFDNMLRGGEVVHPVEASTRAIDQLNRKLATDTRIQSVLLSIADGLVLCRKIHSGNIDMRRLNESRRLS
jgi:caffeoyl-CoA O-methyltransferase